MELIVKIENLKCSGCENQIKNSLLQIKGVQACEINIEDSLVSVGVENDEVESKVLNKLDSMGYPVSPEDNSTPSSSDSLKLGFFFSTLFLIKPPIKIGIARVTGR